MWGWQFANLEKEKPLGCGSDVGVGADMPQFWDGNPYF